MLKKMIVAVLLFFLLFISGCAPIFDLFMPIEGIPMDTMPESEKALIGDFGDLTAGDLGNGTYVSIKDARVAKDDYGNYYLVVSYDFWHGNNIPLSFNNLVRTSAAQGIIGQDFVKCEEAFNEHILTKNIAWRAIQPNFLVEVEIAYILRDIEDSVLVTASAATDSLNEHGQSRLNSFDVPTLTEEAEAAGMLEGETSSYD